jgi:hypothetical protein
MTREIYDIWEVKDGLLNFDWAAQLHNFVAYFETEQKAKDYIQAVKINRGEVKQSSGT